MKYFFKSQKVKIVFLAKKNTEFDDLLAQNEDLAGARMDGWKSEAVEVTWVLWRRMYLVVWKEKDLPVRRLGPAMFPLSG